MDFSNFFDCSWEGFINGITGEIWMSFFIMGLIVLIAVIIRLMYIKDDPLAERKGIKLLLETAIEKLENFIVEIMGKKYSFYTGYFFGLIMYMMLSFIIGVSGLPNPLVSLVVPLSMATCTFVLIHFTAIKANKFRYFKRYFEPMFVFFPINLLSMWSPLLSLTLRLFGNALAGYTFMTIVYYFTRALSSMMFGGGVGQIFVSPFITPFLHLYFDLFSGMIQTLVFAILSMIWISQEDPEDEEEMIKLLKQETI